MPLREYLYNNKITSAAFANLIGYSKTYVDRLRSGDRNPSPRVAKLIEEATHGKVKYKTRKKT